MRLTLYSRSGCHLCQDMLYQLKELLPGPQLPLDVIDIEGQEALEQLYGHKVPVLMGGEDEICHYHLDPQALQSYLNNNRG